MQTTLQTRTLSTGIRRAALLALLVMPACGGADESVSEEAPAKVLSASDVATAERGEIRAGVVLTGTLQPVRRVEVKTQVGGTVTGIRLDVGDAVTAGQTLATIRAEGVRGRAASAAAAVAAAEATVAQARRELASARLLHEAGAMSDLDFQAVETSFESAQAQLASAQAAATGAQEEAGRTVIAAPLTGFVSQRSVEDGEAVDPGTTIYAVVNSSSLELRGQVAVAQAARVRQGQPVEFRIDAWPDRSFTGEVSRVAPVADPDTRQVGVTLQLPNPDAGLIGGLFATGRVIVGESEDVVIVPSAAVRGTEGSRYIWVVDDDQLVRRDVQLGERDDLAGRVAVESGVQAGEHVLVSPGEATEGTRVQIRSVPSMEGEAPVSDTSEEASQGEGR